MAAGLELLGPERLGRVLDLLPEEDLHSARLASRIFDEASRLHTDHATNLKLTLSDAAAEAIGADSSLGRGLTWARFPRLRRLVLGLWRPQHLHVLRSIMAAGGEEGLGGVEEVMCLYWSNTRIDVPTWGAILKRTPRVQCLRLGGPPSGLDANSTAAALSPIASLASRVTHLDTCDWHLDAAGAAVIAANMPKLVALSCRVSSAVAAGVSSKAELWAALPCTRLTELEFCGHKDVLPPLPVKGLPWPRLRVLAGILLPGSHVAALARGLPGLQELTATPEGDWGAPDLLSGGAFASLTSLDLRSRIGGSFCSAAPLPQLFPALERLEWTDGCDGVIACDIPGLTRLTHLELMDGDCSWIAISRGVWDRMHQLGRLRKLEMLLSAEEVPLLARLPACITDLHLHVALRRDQGSESMEWGWGTDEEEFYDACTVLEALARGPRVRKLIVDTHCARCSHAGLARLVRGGALPSLEECELHFLGIRLHDVSALAMLPSLRRLDVYPRDAGAWRSDAIALNLITELAAAGRVVAIMDA